MIHCNRRIIHDFAARVIHHSGHLVNFPFKTLSLFFEFFIEIPNFLNDEECEHIISLAEARGLAASGLFFDKYALASKNYTHGK